MISGFCRQQTATQNSDLITTARYHCVIMTCHQYTLTSCLKATHEATRAIGHRLSDRQTQQLSHCSVPAVMTLNHCSIPAMITLSRWSIPALITLTVKCCRRRRLTTLTAVSFLSVKQRLVLVALSTHSWWMAMPQPESNVYDTVKRQSSSLSSHYLHTSLLLLLSFSKIYCWAYSSQEFKTKKER